jgi:hypothetical protein
MQETKRDFIVSSRNNRAAAKVVHALIGQLLNEDWSLEAARTLVFEELRALKIDRAPLEAILRRAAEATSQDQMLELLNGFASSLLQAGSRLDPQADLLTRIAVPCPDRPKGYYQIIPKRIKLTDDEILYYFNTHVLSSKPMLIRAPWCENPLPQANRIYVRSSLTNPMPTQFHSFVDLQTRLNPTQFFAIHRSIIVNYEAVTEIALAGDLKQVAIVANETVEWLTVSRGYIHTVRYRYGI